MLARRQNHAVRLQTLVFAAGQFAFDGALLIYQYTSQPVTCRSTLAVTQFDQPALPGEDLGREFPAVLTGHRSLDALHDGRDWRSVIFELLCAVRDLYASTPADVFVIGAFVRILEPAPAAHVVGKDYLKIGEATLHVFDQLLQGLSPVNS